MARGGGVSEPVLCYVSGAWAFFTTQPLHKQWGDDWDDAPYEHNAGDPYRFTDHDRAAGREPWEIVQIAWEGDFVAPDWNATNSPYSVEQINAGTVAWLACPTWAQHGINIFAGTPLSTFKNLVRQAGGRVFVEERA
jgi:hypothetical protein